MWIIAVIRIASMIWLRRLAALTAVRATWDSRVLAAAGTRGRRASSIRYCTPVLPTCSTKVCVNLGPPYRVLQFLGPTRSLNWIVGQTEERGNGSWIRSNFVQFSKISSVQLELPLLLSCTVIPTVDEPTGTIEVEVESVVILFHSLISFRITVTTEMVLVFILQTFLKLLYEEPDTVLSTSIFFIS